MKKRQAPKTRAHMILFSEDSPFKGKKERDKTKYTRKQKYRNYE